jgi:hypothetical protein
MRCLVVLHDESWAVMCSLTNKTYKSNKEITGTPVYISLLPKYNSCIFSSRIIYIDRILILISQDLHKQCLSFENKPNNLHNFVLSPSASLRYMQLYQNVNISEVDSFSTHSNGTTGQ